MADLEALRQEEMRTSPTSAYQARALEGLAEAMDYKIKWELNPNKESTASFNSADPASRTITIYMSQKRQGTGTFGHESEHAIKHLLREMYLSEKPGIRTAERRREVEKLITDPVYEHGGDDPSDVSETVPLRIGNVITSERIMGILGDMRHLSDEERLQQFTPEFIRSLKAIQDNYFVEHPNLTNNVPTGTEIGRSQFERLREHWKSKAEAARRGQGQGQGQDKDKDKGQGASGR